MRPDKKKTRHHDSLKCEAKAKLKAAEKAKKAPNKSEKKTDRRNDSGAHGSEVLASGAQAIEAQGSGAQATTTGEGFYAKRQVTSNWTKYEIPSSDEDEGAVTGPDFHFVLENSSKISDRLQLKAERDWDNRSKLAIIEYLFIMRNNKFLSSKIRCKV